MDTVERVEAGETVASAEAPYLSIIIPAYNEERRLPASLDSILAYLAEQPYTAEIIVVENGSSDGTAAVVEQYSAGHPLVRLLRARMRGSQSAATSGCRSTRSRPT